MSEIDGSKYGIVKLWVNGKATDISGVNVDTGAITTGEFVSPKSDTQEEMREFTFATADLTLDAAFVGTLATPPPSKVEITLQFLEILWYPDTGEMLFRIMLNGREMVAEIPTCKRSLQNTAATNNMTIEATVEVYNARYRAVQGRE